MKHQYFGDINDYRKYGLLRLLAEGGTIATGVCWMLTANDGGNDGNNREYLVRRQQFRRFDPRLFDFLCGCAIRQTDLIDNRSVHNLENEDILPETTFFTNPLADGLDSRNQYFAAMLHLFRDRDLVFFDPDNGLENQSPAPGNADSCKFLYFDELARAYAERHSLLVYQHLGQRHMPREDYLAQRVAQLFDRVPVHSIIQFRTPFVAAFLLPQKRHDNYFAQRAFRISSSSWGQGQQIVVHYHDR